VAKLEGRRETLRTWQAYGGRYQQRLADELLPAQRACWTICSPGPMAPGASSNAASSAVWCWT